MTTNHRGYRQASEAELADERRRAEAARADALAAATARHPAGRKVAAR